MKPMRLFLTLMLLLGSVPLLRAQGAFDVAIGFGTAHDTATGAGIESASSVNAFSSCVLSSLDPTCEATPTLGRTFMGFGADGMLNKHFGIEGALNFQPAKGNYGPLQYRQLFYDFDGLFVPYNHKRAQLRLEAGIGGARTGFSYSQTSCVGVAVCTTQAESVGSSNHFQVHAGVGLQIPIMGHLFIRPQFDFRQVPGFTDQFGSDHVLGGSVWVGYNFGEM